MEGLMEGEQLGIQKGHMEGKTEVVLTMYSSGFDLSSISRATGLSIDQITDMASKDQGFNAFDRENGFRKGVRVSFVI
jgi:predicted transposase YdaD